MASILAALRGADLALLHRVNQAWAQPWLDAFFLWLTNLNRSRIFVWGALPVAAAWWLHARRGWAARAILAMALAIGLSDAVAYRFIKPSVRRDRPARAEIRLVPGDNPHTGYGFPSNHAANAFAGATVLGMAEPPLLAPALGIAALVAYSRVYVGAHYPWDVFAGALLGLLLGFGVGNFFLLRGGPRHRPRATRR